MRVENLARSSEEFDMAIPFVADIDMRGNEILDFRVPRVNGLPTATAAQNGVASTSIRRL